MAGSKRLIVGLGNPSSEYDGSRHNIGFVVVDRIAEKTKAAFDESGMIQKALDRMKSAGLYMTASGRYRGRPVTLAKPLTFMNRSGEAVLRLKTRFGLDDQDILVVVDDIYLDLGILRLKSRGGSGGHNGLQDIIDRLGSDNFPRMRIGVGSTFSRGQQARFVLAPFEDDERILADETVGMACEAALTFVTEGIVTAMNRYNKRSKSG
jgi:PTH1 family peptidyl-tRNA hydrolase